jgi:hypothetical protein
MPPGDTSPGYLRMYPGVLVRSRLPAYFLKLNVLFYWILTIHVL